MNTTPDPLDARWFVVDEEAWDALNERLDQPADAKPRLAALLGDAACHDCCDGWSESGGVSHSEDCQGDSSVTS